MRGASATLSELMIRPLNILFLALFSLLIVTTSAFSEAYVVLKDHGKIVGESVRLRSNGDVVLTTSAGKVTYRKGVYIKAVAERPKRYDEALSWAKKGEYRKAESALKRIVKSYEGLEWDLEAMEALAKVQASRERHQRLL